MNKTMTRILLLEDNQADIALLQEVLDQETYFKKQIDICDSVADGVYRLCTQSYDIVLLDLNLSDCKGEETFNRVYTLSQQVPIIITGINDHEFALRLVKKGAQDFMIKGQLDGAAIVRTIQYAIERKQLMSSLQKLSKALEQSPVSVAITDIDGKIEYVNERFNHEAGSKANELIGTNPRFEKVGYFAQSQNQEIWDIIAAGQEWQGEVRNKNNGEESWEYVSVTPVVGANEKVANYLVIKEDITVRKRYEEQLFQKNNFDVLTGLPNRHLATDRLNQLLETSTGNGQEIQFALIFIGLRSFHTVNDSYGHAFGDKLLVDMAGRLKKTLRADDTLARFGGDEFLIIIRQRPGEAINTERMVAKALECIETPYLIDGTDISVRACIGISLYPADGREAQGLVNNAHVAMNHCKSDQSRSLRYFQSHMNEAALKRFTIESRLRSAIRDKELSLVFQPQVLADTNELIGAEALLRWHNKELGMVPPDVFIPIAEDTDLILKIGAWVLKEACTQFRRWQEMSGKNYKLAVNISTRQLMEERHFIKLVSETLSETGFPPKSLELEITEHTLVAEHQKAADVIGQLKQLGVAFAIDDFGVGYSSLSYIKDFPLNALKIDRSFLRGVPENAGDNNLARAIIALGHSFGLSVIAEGIETQQQLDFIREHGCDAYQGYFFAKPLIPQEFEDKLIKKTK